MRWAHRSAETFGELSRAAHAEATRNGNLLPDFPNRVSNWKFDLRRRNKMFDMQSNPFQKNLEAWQALNTSAVENLMSLFEKNLETSQAFQNQMQTAVEKVVNSQFEMLNAGISAMQQQMDQLLALLKKDN